MPHWLVWLYGKTAVVAHMQDRRASSLPFSHVYERFGDFSNWERKQNAFLLSTGISLPVGCCIGKVTQFSSYKQYLGHFILHILHFLVSNSFWSKLTLRSGERMTGGESGFHMQKYILHLTSPILYWVLFVSNPCFVPNTDCFGTKKENGGLKSPPIKKYNFIKTVESRKEPT